MIFEHFTQIFSCNVVVYYFNVPIYITFKINMVIYLDYKDLYELSRFFFCGKKSGFTAVKETTQTEKQ